MHRGAQGLQRAPVGKHYSSCFSVICNKYMDTVLLLVDGYYITNYLMYHKQSMQDQ